MKNPFRYSRDNKRYHTLNYYNRSNFGEKIYKAVLNCGFTCPNIDGSKGIGGCIFCDAGSGYFTRPELTVSQQLDSEIRRISTKLGYVPRIAAYLQSNTNTYTSPEILRSIMEDILSYHEVAGVAIGTRGDCLADDMLDLLEYYSHRTSLTVELGMQTVHEKTITLINRCCTHSEFLEGYHKIKERGIRVCLHIINGLPDESADMMLETVRQAAALSPDAVKLQMLHVIRGTKLAEMYSKVSMELLSKDEYIDIIVRQLELLPPETVIERITGDGDKSKLIAPMWSADKISVLGGIDKRLAELDTYQGRLYNR